MLFMMHASITSCFPAFTFKIRHFPVCTERRRATLHGRSTRTSWHWAWAVPWCLAWASQWISPRYKEGGGGLGVVRFPPIHVIVGTSETSEEGLKCFCESGDKGFLRYSHCFQRAKLHALRLEAEVTHLGYFVLSCLIGALEAKSNIWPRLKTRPAVWKS